MAMFWQLSPLLCAAVLVCIPRPGESQVGTACPPSGCSSVIPNTECKRGACECQQGFYDDSGSDCLPRKGLGEKCANTIECQDSSHCEGGQCATTVTSTTVNATDGNNNGAGAFVSTVDKTLVIQMFLVYVLVKRN